MKPVEGAHSFAAGIERKLALTRQLLSQQSNVHACCLCHFQKSGFCRIPEPAGGRGFTGVREDVACGL